MTPEQKAWDFYIEYINDYLTVSGIADAHGISEAEANKLITMGRALNDSQGERTK